MTKKGFFAAILVIFCVSFSPANPTEGPKLEFELERYDYGIVYTDNLPDKELKVEFKNTGTAPLILSQVKGCCGTRIIEWPEKPINPGEKGVITIEIRMSARPQRISRTLTVNSNSVTNPTAIFRIVGEVKESESNPPR